MIFTKVERKIILDALEKGICKTEENGAVSIELEAEKLGKKILIRGDGTGMYITQDINTTVQKYKDYSADYNLFVVGNEQENHFKILFTVLKKFGFHWAENCEHISYGMIELPEGKMKSREGKVVDLDNLIDELKAWALTELEKRELENLNRRTSAQLEQTAEDIAQAAIKFELIKTNTTKNIVFNPKESISFDGMTGPYLQYTHARIVSLMEKAKRYEFVEISEDFKWTAEETNILAMTCFFTEKITYATKSRNPASFSKLHL